MFASLTTDNAAGFCRGLATYLAPRLGAPVRVVEDRPWQDRERMLFRGEAHVGVVCGLQYVYPVDRGERPGDDTLHVQPANAHDAPQGREIGEVPRHG